MDKVKVRFAPSPTGSLHIGGVRTALYCYALAKRHNGEFMVRVEDTDQKRMVEGSEDEIFEMLTKYGLQWDTRTKQSERLDIYKKHAEELIEKGAAYYCFATAEEIADAKKIADQNKEQFSFSSPYRELPLEEAKKRVFAGDKYVIRQKIEKGVDVTLEDGVQGTVKFNTDDINESVILKSDGFPTYHLAVVVDDHLMEISHVFRGVEWLSSAPKHVLLYESFGWEMPKFYHLALILDPAGGKLSKRNGSVAAADFLKQGYLPEAILNFLMLLGWSSPLEREHGEKEREIFSLTEFVEMFDLHDLNKASPVFNREKLIWFNQQYIKIWEIDHLQNKFVMWLKEFSDDSKLKELIVEKGPDYLQKTLVLVRARSKLLSEIPDLIKLFYSYDAKSIDFSGVKKLKKLNEADIKLAIGDFLLALNEVNDFAIWSKDIWEKDVRAIADSYELKHGALFMSLRYVVTGTQFSPSLFETMEALSKEEVIIRIKSYLG